MLIDYLKYFQLRQLENYKQQKQLMKSILSEKKFEKTGVVKELRNRQQYTKFSIVRREEIKHAIYINKLRSEEQ